MNHLVVGKRFFPSLLAIKRVAATRQFEVKNLAMNCLAIAKTFTCQYFWQKLHSGC